MTVAGRGSRASIWQQFILFSSIRLSRRRRRGRGIIPLNENYTLQTFSERVKKKKRKYIERVQGKKREKELEKKSAILPTRLLLSKLHVL